MIVFLWIVWFVFTLLVVASIVDFKMYKRLIDERTGNYGRLPPLAQAIANVNKDHASIEEVVKKYLEVLQRDAAWFNSRESNIGNRPLGTLYLYFEAWVKGEDLWTKKT